MRGRWSIAFGQADALLFPTTPCAAPRTENQWKFQVGGKDVADIFLSRNTHPSSSAGVPGISLPMALNSEGLPLGLELDAAAGRDRDLLALARRVEQVIGRVPGPTGFEAAGTPDVRAAALLAQQGEQVQRRGHLGSRGNYGLSRRDLSCAAKLGRAQVEEAHLLPTNWTRAATSRRGKSRNSSRATCGH